eukprot:TCALIF_04135-PA protein Name:"Similar to Lrrc45 Leucine-rich repeat-containing protein 45 (Mus musculus)" AED:0.03 eAED:0.01 QI:0/0.71/0.25/0.87/0.85/0.87/8/236/639
MRINRDGVVVFHLSSRNLNSNECSELAKRIGTDSDLFEFDLTDSYLDQKNLSILLKGLACNQSIQVVNLKGNNLSGDNIALLGLVLKQTTVIQRLCLSWNDLGLEADYFGAFCSGLRENDSLVALNLSNNCLTHKHAQQLANSLQMGVSTLKNLDLRWNNIGSLGGQAFLDALKTNRKLLSIQLEGNQIPSEILSAICHMLHQNSETEIILQAQKHQTLTLEEKLSNFQSQLKHHEEVKTHELRDMEHDFKDRNDSLHFEIGKLKSALDQKILNEGTLQEKLKFTQQALNLAEDQVKDLLRRDQSRENHLRKIHDNCNSFEKDIRQEWIAKEESYMRQIEDLDAKVASMRSREAELKNECVALQGAKDQALRELEHELQAKSRDKDHWELQMDSLKNAHQDNIGKLNDVYERDKIRLIEANAQERERWEQLKARQENAIQKMKTQIEDLKVQIAAGMSQHKSQIEAMEREYQDRKGDYILHSESKTALMRKEISEVQLELKVLHQKLESKQEQVSNLEGQILDKTAEIAQLEKVIGGFQKSKEALRDTISKEFQARLEDAEEKSKQIPVLLTKMEAAEKEIAIVVAKRGQEVQKRDDEILDLKGELKKQHDVITHLRNNEEKRKAQLSSALQGLMKAEM